MPNLQIVHPDTNDRKFIPELWASVFEQIMYDRGFISIENYVYNPDKEGFCIIRHTGGLGDIICLMPAINSLLKKYKKITVILPEEFKDIFKFYPEVEFKSYWDSNYIEESKSYKHFYDMYCPAGDHELITGFKPTRSRISSFAKFLEVDVGDISFRWKSKKIKKNNKVIIIQHSSQMPAKDIPIEFFKEIHEELSKEFKVYFISNVAKIENYNSLITPSLARLFDVVANSDLTISADSALYHVSSFLNIPAIGIFGPTDGKTTSEFYPKAHFIQLPGIEEKCLYPCYYSSTRKFYCKDNIGDCMKSINVKKVLSLCYSILKGVDDKSV